MGISVLFYDDVGSFSTITAEFLQSRAVLHNLILTIVDGRMRRHEPGRYWAAFRDGQVVGVVVQSPLTFPATLVPMETDVIAALADAIAHDGILLPGVNGEAATAASFAGRWTERCKSAAFPDQGFRLYELVKLSRIRPVVGKLLKADAKDRDMAVAWLREFNVETHTPDSNTERLIDASLSSGSLWFWRDGVALSMAMSSNPAQGVVRVSAVYTPPENRKCGYAAACVHGVSKHFADAGYRCMLYTDLSNPTSNSIYRSIGYRVVTEAIQYRFDHF